jgi:23S rRNA-/tRNA-specific pseudouridylate synthase
VQVSGSKQEIKMKFSFSTPVPEVLYQDEDILVVIKPAGMPSLPDKLGFMDLQTFLQTSFGQSKAKPDVSIKLIHKLDRPVGDGKYNKLFSTAKQKGWYKLALFSSEIFFRHPRTGKEMTFIADPYVKDPLAFPTLFPEVPKT